jgi:hypothetical protein
MSVSNVRLMQIRVRKIEVPRQAALYRPTQGTANSGTSCSGDGGVRACWRYSSEGTGKRASFYEANRNRIAFGNHGFYAQVHPEAANELLPNWYRLVETSPSKDAEYFCIRREETTYSVEIFERSRFRPDCRFEWEIRNLFSHKYFNVSTSLGSESDDGNAI